MGRIIVWWYWRWLALAGGIVALDQWTKWLVRQHIPFGGWWLPGGWEWLGPYARIVHWYNTGAAFGMFQNGNKAFIVLAVVVIGVILYYALRLEMAEWWLRLALAMQLAGAVGNLIDRLTLGKVTDFISVGTFPVFNLADASITLGVGILLLGMWWKERLEQQRRLSEAASALRADASSPIGAAEHASGPEAGPSVEGEALDPPAREQSPRA